MTNKTMMNMNKKKCNVLIELHEMVDILHNEVCKNCPECSSDNPECALRKFIDGYDGLYDADIDTKLSEESLEVYKKIMKGLKR